MNKNPIKSKIINCGSQHLKKGRFLKRKRNDKASCPKLNGERNFNTLTHLYTLESRDVIHKQLLYMIRCAEKSIGLVSFVFDEGPLVANLVKELAAAYKRGINVRIFTTLRTDQLTVKQLAENEDIDFSSHMNVVRELADAGIPLRARTDCHGKFCITDNCYALVSSANMTDFSLNRNPEYGCYYTDKIEAKKLAYIFDLLWDKACQYKVNNERGSFLVEEVKHDWNNFVFKPSTNPDYELLYTFVNDTKFSQTAASLFRQAEDNITISSYVIKCLEDTPVGVELLKALDRGVKVTVITRPQNRRNDHLEACHLLYEKGAQIYGNLFNHAKIFSIDNKAGTVFTGNLDGQHGLENGIEFGVYLKNPDSILYALEFNEYLKQDSRFYYQYPVTQEQLAQTQGRDKQVRFNEPLTLWFLQKDLSYFESFGQDEVRFGKLENKQVCFLTPDFALICQEINPNEFRVTQTINNTQGYYSKLSRKLDKYLVKTTIKAMLD